MQRYGLRLYGGVAWQFEFRQPSYGMAIEYARGILQRDPCAKGAMGAWLFNMDQQDGENCCSFTIQQLTEVTSS
jgi:hypothetical protein